jgi:hypothetical protein
MPSLTRKMRLRAAPGSVRLGEADGAAPVGADIPTGKAATAAPETAPFKNARLDVSDMRFKLDRPPSGSTLITPGGLAPP